MTKHASNGFRTVLFQLMTDPARSVSKQAGPAMAGTASDRLKQRA